MSTPPGPADPGPVPTFSTEVRWFGVAPPLLLASLALATVVGAVALFGLGHWPYGLVLLGVAALLGAVLLETVRRRPGTPGVRAVVSVSGTVRGRVRAAAESVLARSGALAETQRVRSARAVIAAERRQSFLRLGETIHRGDAVGESEARGALAALDRAEQQLEERLRLRLEETDARLRSAKLAAQATVVRIPEPYPPPDEGTPPTPAPIPEPSPDPKPDEDERRPAA